jgi:hypothetical protein
MKRLFQSVLFGLMALAIPALAGEVIDRVVATVNSVPILQSDVTESLAFEALADGKPLRTWRNEDLMAEIDRLIDQQLLKEQMQAADTVAPAEDQIMQRVKEIRTIYSGAASDKRWADVLMEHGLTQKQVEDHITQQMLILRFVDARLRAGTTVGNRSIENYYRDTLVPQVTKEGKKPPSLEQATPEIREILMQKRMDDLLNTWLQSLRAEGRVRKLDASKPSPDGGQSR